VLTALIISLHQAFCPYFAAEATTMIMRGKAGMAWHKENDYPTLRSFYVVSLIIGYGLGFVRA
jgi:hypothetical protein